MSTAGLQDPVGKGLSDLPLFTHSTYIRSLHYSFIDVLVLLIYFLSVHLLDTNLLNNLLFTSNTLRAIQPFPLELVFCRGKITDR